jgi:hypothetical protein
MTRREGGRAVWSATGPKRSGAGSCSVGAGEWRERGGGPVRGNGWWASPGKKKGKKKEMGSTQGNSVTF